MIITSYGASCFKVVSSQTVLAFDPPSKKSNVKSPYFQSDLVLISHDHDDHNGRDVLHAKEDGLFLIEGPGEYEHKGVAIYGIPTLHDDKGGKKYGRNTIYRVELEDIVLLHMGDFGEKELSGEVKEKIREVDVLFLPIGGETVLSASEAADIANQIEPGIIIPTHYDNQSDAKKKSAIKEFLDEMGLAGLKAEEKLTIKKKDVPEKETKIVLLEPSSS